MQLENFILISYRLMILYIKIPTTSSAFAKLCHLPDFVLLIVITLLRSNYFIIVITFAMFQLFYLFLVSPFYHQRFKFN